MEFKKPAKKNNHAKSSTLAKGKIREEKWDRACRINGKLNNKKQNYCVDISEMQSIYRKRANRGYFLCVVKDRQNVLNKWTLTLIIILNY